jgi:prolyl-tRNA editing enzyme YbaK/EbsC (Cys-tRNA(Pro) deacylase)
VKSALDVHRTLLADGVPHEMLRLRAAALSADDLPRGLEVDARSCVALRCYVVTEAGGGQRLCAVMVAAGDTPEPLSVLDALEATSLRPATAAEVNAATDYAAPLVSPICLPPEVLLLADARLGAQHVLYTPTGESGVALGISTRDLLVASGARVTTLTATPRAEAERLDWQLGAGLETADAQVLPLERPVRASRRTGRRRAGRTTG